VNGPVTVASNTMVFGIGLAICSGLAFVLILAQPTAVRRVPTALESVAVVTSYDELASNAPISTLDPALSPAGPRTAPR